MFSLFKLDLSFSASHQKKPSACSALIVTYQPEYTAVHQNEMTNVPPYKKNAQGDITGYRNIGGKRKKAPPHFS